MSDAAVSNDAIEVAIRAGTARALRKRAAAQRAIAAEGTALLGDRFPGAVLRTPEAALANNLAAGLERIADDLEIGRHSMNGPGLEGARVGGRAGATEGEARRWWTPVHRQSLRPMT